MMCVGLLVERDAAHVVAIAAGPDQVDVGGVVGAGDFDLALREVGIEVAAFGEPAGDAGLAGLVDGVVEHRAGPGGEDVEFLLQVTVAAAFALDRDMGIAHAHRRARDHGDGDRGGCLSPRARCTSICGE